MIKRISMWKLKDKADANKMKDALMSMEGKVSSLEHIEVGINTSSHGSAYDIVFTGIFKNRRALEDFESDEIHKAVGEMVGQLRDNRIVVEYEC